MSPQMKREGKISYGITSYGYDCRLGYKFKVPTPHKCTGGIIDPKVPDPGAYMELDLTPPACHDWITNDRMVKLRCRRCGIDQECYRQLRRQGQNVLVDADCFSRTVPNYIIVPPNSLVLGETVEVFTIPRSVLCIVIGKSSYARCGLICNCTPLEPEWTGKVTLELTNTNPMPMKVYCGEGIAQFVFLRSDGYRHIHANDLRHLIEPGSSSSNPSEYEKAVLRDSGTCRVSYADKGGRYQAQTGVELSRADGKEAVK